MYAILKLNKSENMASGMRSLSSVGSVGADWRRNCPSWLEGALIRVFAAVSVSRQEGTIFQVYNVVTRNTTRGTPCPLKAAAVNFCAVVLK